MRNFGLKRMLLSTALILVFPAFGLTAEQLTTVGVVDMERILNEFFTQSEDVREWQQNVRDFDSNRRQIEDEIAQLESERLDALEDGDELTALELEEEIDDRRAFLNEFTRIRRAQLERQREELLQGGGTFFNQVNSAMSFVAQSEGYTIIIDSEADGILWFASEVDVTDKVIERLEQTL